MTATLTYNPRNRLAKSTMDYIQSLGVFTITSTPTHTTRRKITNTAVDKQLMNDLKGALREVKECIDGKIQMKNAYDLLNEL